MKQMKTTYKTWACGALLLAWAWTASGCSNEVEIAPGPSAEATIRINTRAEGEGGDPEGSVMAMTTPGPTLFFLTEEQYGTVAPTGTSTRETPSLQEGNYTYRVLAPERVDTYRSALYDTGKQYPKENDEAYLYAIGFAPTEFLKPKQGEDGKPDYSVLTVEYGEFGEFGHFKGSTDFLSCDANEKCKGSLSDPFGQPENVLNFRHLTAKVSFYAYRHESMQGKQQVRNVFIQGLKAKYNTTDTYANLCAPTEFTWTDQNAGTTIGDDRKKNWGYSKTKAESFGVWLEMPKSDGLLVGEERASWLSTIYVCDPTDHKVKDGDQLSLQMTVGAQLSFLPDFADLTSDEDGYKVWQNMEVDVKEINNGTVSKTSVKNFAPGHEYKVYLCFKPTGLYLQARRVPWEVEGPHYVPILPNNPSGAEDE